jgi:hypothetical protein
MTKIEGSGSTPKCHGSATLTLSPSNLVWLKTRKLCCWVESSFSLKIVLIQESVWEGASHHLLQRGVPRLPGPCGSRCPQQNPSPSVSYILDSFPPPLSTPMPPFSHPQVRGASKIKLKNVNKKRMATARRLIFFGISQGVHCWSDYTVVFIITKIWRRWRQRQRR